MKGRKPKPTALKLLHGRTSHTKKKPEGEPIPPGELTLPPEWMTADQKEAWVYALANAPPGLLRRIDRATLAVWVVAEDTHAKAATQLALGGPSLLMTHKSMPMPFPSIFLSVMNKQAMVMLKAAGELGFTPTSRARIYSGDSPPPPDPAAEIYRRARKEPTTLAGFIASAPPRPTMN